MENKNILINHYDVLSAFNEDYYKDLITADHLGDEVTIKVNGNKEFVYPVKYRGKLYAIPSAIVEAKKLPIKIKACEKADYRSKVYHFVNKYASAKITEYKSLTWRQLINTLGNFKHTKGDEFTIYKIVMIMLYLRKGFARVVSEAAFGKNSIPTILKILMTDISIINPRSAPAFEMRLYNPLVVLDELTNLAKEQRDLMQEALLRTGDGSPSYEKGTRGSAKIGTKDEYDIGNLSIAILYNVYQYYLDAGQGEKYFDNVFQHAVKDRYLPLAFEGVLDGTQFMAVKRPKEVAEALKEDIKGIIKSIKYYQNNIEKEIKPYKLKKEYRLSKSGRIDKTFQMICDGFNLYAQDEDEYNKMVEKFYMIHMKYASMLKEDDVEELPLDAEVKPKVKQQTL